MAPAGFYTYVHTRADDGKVFYVGKGRGLRLRQTDGRNPWWRKIARKHGWNASTLAYWSTEVEAFEHERFLIACFKDMGAPLCNLTEGGEGRSGYYLSEEAKRRISEKKRGRQHTAEHRLKNAAAQVGTRRTPESIAKTAAGNRGLKRSEETRQVLADLARGRPMSDETRAKVIAANKGRKRSDEFKAKVSAGLRGRPVSAETREKIAAAHRGRIISAEHRLQIAATLRGRPQSEERKAKHREVMNRPEVKAKTAAARAARRAARGPEQ